MKLLLDLARAPLVSLEVSARKSIVYVRKPVDVAPGLYELQASSLETKLGFILNNLYLRSADNDQVSIDYGDDRDHDEYGIYVLVPPRDISRVVVSSQVRVIFDLQLDSLTVEATSQGQVVLQHPVRVLDLDLTSQSALVADYVSDLRAHVTSQSRLVLSASDSVALICTSQSSAVLGKVTRDLALKVTSQSSVTLLSVVPHLEGAIAANSTLLTAPNQDLKETSGFPHNRYPWGYRLPGLLDSSRGGE